tara:strand:+ start:516 stop:1292 length:777 start_codon:yes stop_codon:yes gene_type:complete
MPTVRIFQMVKELNISHTVILSFLKAKGMNINSYMSPLGGDALELIMEEFAKDKKINDEFRKIVDIKIRNSQIENRGFLDEYFDSQNDGFFLGPFGEELGFEVPYYKCSDDYDLDDYMEDKSDDYMYNDGFDFIAKSRENYIENNLGECKTKSEVEKLYRVNYNAKTAKVLAEKWERKNKKWNYLRRIILTYIKNLLINNNLFNRTAQLFKKQDTQIKKTPLQTINDLFDDYENDKRRLSWIWRIDNKLKKFGQSIII